MKVSAIILICIVISSLLHAQVEDFKDTDFNKADSIARLYPKHSLKDLKHLAEKLTKPLHTEEEKFRAIYTWVCLNIDNDYMLFQKNQNNRNKLKDPEALKKWNDQIKKTVFETLYKDYRTVCTGYAYLVRELCLFAGINSFMVDGYGRTIQSNIGGHGIANHTWNAVKLNNQWYLCDATWSSGAIDTEKGEFVKKYDDAYFLLDPSLFARNHYPLDTTWMLLDTKPTLETFLNRPLIYSSGFKHKITPLFPETFHVTVAKGKPLSFQFTSDPNFLIKNTELQVAQGSDVPLAYFPSVTQNENEIHFMEYTFKRKGTFTVHVLLNNAYAFTYSVKVI